MQVKWVYAALCGGALVMAGPAMADDWVAAKLRGTVLALDGQQWVRLNRGDVVSDARVIRTMNDGYVTFVRDNETIDVSGNTQLQIHDHKGQRFTTVSERSARSRSTRMSRT